MENNFYVGIVCHGKRLFKPKYKEKVVLYSEDNVIFLDLKQCCCYTIDDGDRDYVEKDSLISTDVSQYRDDYIYLLDKYKSDISIKKRFRNLK